MLYWSLHEIIHLAVVFILSSSLSLFSIFMMAYACESIWIFSNFATKQQQSSLLSSSPLICVPVWNIDMTVVDRKVQTDTKQYLKLRTMSNEGGMLLPRTAHNFISLHYFKSYRVFTSLKFSLIWIRIYRSCWILANELLMTIPLKTLSMNYLRIRYVRVRT